MTADGLNVTAASLFALFVVVTLFLTWRAAGRSSSRAEFYAAGSRIGGLANGLAISGDFMSAATFLGIVGLVFATGYDVIVYVLSPLIGLSIILFVLARPIRKLGRFTITDVCTYRLRERPIRVLTACCSLIIVVLYLVAQFVGAGKLVQLLFGISYGQAVVTAGVLTMVYVGFGGMLATTWVQITKAILMLSVLTFMAGYALSLFDFSLLKLYGNVASVHGEGARVFAPGLLFPDAISLLSLALAFPLGFAGMPHILMRLYTVPDVHQANISVFFATLFIGFVMVLVYFVIPYAGVVLLPQHPEFYAPGGGLIGGNNMVSIHIARAIGGDFFFGVVAAVGFATILAVVCGLVLAGASAVSHDLYARGLKNGAVSEGGEVVVTRLSCVLLGAAGIALALAFEHQNIAYMVSLVFVVSASTNFPLLILCLYWRGLTTRGALIGGITGLVASTSLLVVGPTIWVEILGYEAPLFPLKYPGIVTIPLAFLVMWMASKLDRSAAGNEDRVRFDQQIAALAH